MGADEFDRDLGRLAGALGDPTRRGIYLTVRGSEVPMTAARIAQLFTIHPNVARHHLDRLVAEGYLRVSDRPAPRPAGAGRPPRTFEATDTDVGVSYPARRLDLLAKLLVQVVERLSPGEAAGVAHEVGRAYAAELAGDVGLSAGRDFPEALAEVARVMTGDGFEITADTAQHRLVRGVCPFGRTDAAGHSDIVCHLDLGIVEGLMEAAGAGAGEVLITSRRHPGKPCFHS
ncbi:MAG TPA: helix-turn-helix domain-containing protein [Acidimicrobiia bacterium]|nr:helix-turn-helix domain-containing protein [Acidimicrobiia bacterium]